jgi:large subunit ribosomal protein L19
MSGSVGVERIFPVNLPALQKSWNQQKGAVRRARIFYFRELTGKKQNQRQKKIVKYLFIIKVPTVSDFFLLF